MSQHDDWDTPREEKFALKMAPLMQEILRDALAKLPAGTECGFILLVPPVPGHLMGRTLAVTTDREKVARGAAAWVLEVLRPMPRG